MRKFLLIVSLVVGFSGHAVSQSTAKTSCPSISVSGPAGIVKGDENVTFTVNILNAPQNAVFEYLWEISNGAIITGQGTNAIDVRRPFTEAVTARVTVKGMPIGCADTASEIYALCITPPPTKLDEMIGPLAKISPDRFKKVVESSKSDPNAQIYIFISGARLNRESSVMKKRQYIFERIVTRHGEEPSRITFVDLDTTDDRVVIWLVPAGANNPTP